MYSDSMSKGFKEDNIILILAYYQRYGRISPCHIGPIRDLIKIKDVIKNSLEFLSSAFDGMSLPCERVPLDERTQKAYKDLEQFRRMMGVGPFGHQAIVSTKLTNLKKTLQKIVDGENTSPQEIEETREFYSKASRDELVRTSMIIG